MKNFERHYTANDSTRVHYFRWSGNEHVVWENEDKELEVDGRLYDVLSIQKNNETVTIMCIEDNEEQELADNYRATFHDKRAAGNSTVCTCQVMDLKYLKVEPVVIMPLLFTIPFDYIIFTPADIACVCIRKVTPPPEC